MLQTLGMITTSKLCFVHGVNTAAIRACGSRQHDRAKLTNFHMCVSYIHVLPSAWICFGSDFYVQEVLVFGWS